MELVFLVFLIFCIAISISEISDRITGKMTYEEYIRKEYKESKNNNLKVCLNDNKIINVDFKNKIAK